MKLAAFLLRAGYTDREFAEKIGVERSTVTYLRKGRSRPSLKVMERIAVATHGKVMPNDFIGSSQP